MQPARRLPIHQRQELLKNTGAERNRPARATAWRRRSKLTATRRWRGLPRACRGAKLFLRRAYWVRLLKTARAAKILLGRTQNTARTLRPKTAARAANQTFNILPHILAHILPDVLLNTLLDILSDAILNLPLIKPLNTRPKTLLLPKTARLLTGTAPSGCAGFSLLPSSLFGCLF